MKRGDQVTTRFKTDPGRPAAKQHRRTCKNPECKARFTVPEWQLRQSSLSGSYCSRSCRFDHMVAKNRDKPSSDRFGRTWRKDDRDWSKAVRDRDGHRCQFPGCSVGGPGMHAHHRLSRSQYPHRKYDISVGVTLCPQHHAHVHSHPDESRRLGLLNPQSAKYERERRNGRLS